MDFFENLGRKITDFADNAGDKVKEFTETNKLKGEVNTEKEKLVAAYVEIGKKVYKADLENTDSPYQELFTRVTAINKRIEELEAQIAEIKKKTEEDASARKAAAEKAEQEDANAETITAEPVTPASKEVAERKTCPNCQADIPIDARFCSSCGTSL